ncbi:natural product biosynthesis luciferase-like monooxygenase protein [Chitinophaga dinghuensis]|uniref:Natural product biosynthesis luciferase-like monooxygenase protein n=1 Tax=Chitinophaga dinghuensis TaxID=1539050 RepID=A0A327VRU0_9BACT|nr:MupA/Atu3671 family FMN-dependent luciferase-like monooxygenase [Chitinophaga dinghuensis]RAJ72775.1 natural product biosynthesis luciferase-like monooxygenase protein [Chitinophaga dinghuensis]
MKMENLLKKLRDHQIAVSLENQDLKIKFNGDSLPPDLLKELKENKEQLVSYLSALNSGVDNTVIRPLPESSCYTMSSGQARVWILSQFEEANLAYNMPGVFVFEGRLQIDALERALNKLIARYEILRTYFRDDEQGEIKQFILGESAVDFHINQYDLRKEPDADGQVKAMIQEELVRPFDLRTAPLLRTCLFQLSDDKWIFTYVMHHIISDGWSMDILIRELMYCYNAFIQHQEPDMKPLPIQYKEYAAWQHEQLESVVRGSHRNYWMKQFEGELPVLNLIGDFSRPALKTYRGSAVGRRINKDITRSIKELNQEAGTTLFMGLLSAVYILLYRYTGQQDLIIGTPVAGRDHIDLEDQIGLFLNTLALRTSFDGQDSYLSMLEKVKQVTLAAYEHQLYPFDRLVDDLHLKRDTGRSPLFDVMMILQNARVKGNNKQQFGDVMVSSYDRGEHAVSKFDLTFDFIEVGDELQASIEYNSDIFSRDTAAQLLLHLEGILVAISAAPRQAIYSLDYLGEAEKNRLLHVFNNTALEIPADATIISLFEQQVKQSPDSIAVVMEDRQLTYAQLHAATDRLAAYLHHTCQVKRNDLIGIRLQRSEWMIIAILGVLKSGAAYLPIDPQYPADRIKYIIEDSGCIAVIDEALLSSMQEQPAISPLTPVVIMPEQLAYCIYTSGTTGLPKGCLLTHANVVNFFYGMTATFGGTPGTMLALTNYTFDISVLELLWTLTLGYKVVIQGDVRDIVAIEEAPVRPLEFSLFYFGNADNNDAEDKYRLLLEGAKYADNNGFAAVWTPERHFHEFGGLYPSPALMGSALAVLTKNISIRAGSVVLPLHHPLRVAEEWSVIDNLSGGRVGIACASGWHAGDFVLSPGEYSNRHEHMYKMIDTVQRLWRGEQLEFPDGNNVMKKTRIFPSPRQKELPIWLTSANSIQTFISAGKAGAGVLTHLLGETTEGLAVKIAAYRKAFAESGHDIKKAKVALMLHTYIGDDIDTTYEKARVPFMNYLRTSVSLMKTFAADLNVNIESEQFSEEDMQSLLEHAFNRYVSTASLIGTRATAMEMLKKLSRIGVDEIACLIDFGVGFADTMNGLENITVLKDSYHKLTSLPSKADYAVHTQLRQHQVTHLQATPSMASLLQADSQAMGSLRTILLGGERLPVSLVQDLYSHLPEVQLYNMYGPTETTIWSACSAVPRHTEKITIGRPIANTHIYILDAYQQLLPVGAEGEIYIGGKGVASHYVNKPELSAERFLADPFLAGERVYRTGDFGRWLPDGSIEYIGRKDDQVKISGHRIELGEIEAALLDMDNISAAVVLAKQVRQQEKELVAYVVTTRELDTAAIRKALLQKLPAYMVPGYYMQLDALPLTPNGKVDRKQLPEYQQQGSNIVREHIAAANEVEQKLVDIWHELLGCDDIGTNDNFFDLGGNSIKIVRMVMTINKIFDKKLSVAMAFRYTTIAALSKYLTEENVITGESDKELDMSVNIMEDTFNLLNSDLHDD